MLPVLFRGQGVRYATGGGMPGVNTAETLVAAITPMYSVQSLSIPECPHQLPSAAVQLRSCAGICLVVFSIS